jgi:hypothetical protein
MEVKKVRIYLGGVSRISLQCKIGKQLGEGIPFLAPQGKESGTWRVDFTLIVILKPVKRLGRDFRSLKLAPLAPFRERGDGDLS